MVFRSKEQRETVEYVKTVKSGAFTGRKPEHIQESDATIKSWLKNGTNMPDEMYDIQQQAYWDAELNPSKSNSKGLPIPNLTDPEDILATTIVSGFGLGLVALVNPALVPVVLGFAGKCLLGIGLTSATTGLAINIIRDKVRGKSH